MSRILVVDDDVDIYKLLKFKLQSLGHTVFHADNGADALKAIDSDVPDLILLDVMIPVYDGFYVLREVRKRDETVPIIMLTAKGQEQDVLRGLDEGANDYVTKPFSPPEIALRCKRWLNE